MTSKVFNILNQIGVLIVASVAGIWWSLDEVPQSQGAIFLIAMWVLVFDYLPIKDFKCLQESIVKFYYLPLAILGSAGFLYGVFQTNV